MTIALFWALLLAILLIKMKTILLTQFLRPHGKQRPVFVEVSDEAGTKWEDEIEPLGLRLTAEVIPMGSTEPDGDRTEEEQVCVAIENPQWGDYRLSLCPNIPGGPIGKEVEKLIQEFDKSDYHAWLEELTEDE